MSRNMTMKSMKDSIKSILVISLGTLCVIALAISDLIRVLQGKQSIDEEWHEAYVDGRINNGQGRKE